jgi:ABC-type dipeptide/oligopeptide/nickel transport system ATPase subunit
MSKTILIMGESGSGKTTSMRNLDPKTTYYIDADKKGLSWKGWKRQYSTENKNYISTSNSKLIKTILQGISKDRPNIKTIIIDTLNGIMIDDEFGRMKEKGFDKWQDMAYSIYDIVNISNTLREDLTIIFCIHSQTERDDSGYAFTRAKTSGKKLDKIVIESKFTSVLLAKVVDGKYIFETKSNNSTVKTPMGAFEEEIIENDIVPVIKALDEY